MGDHDDDATTRAVEAWTRDGEAVNQPHRHPSRREDDAVTPKNARGELRP